MIGYSHILCPVDFSDGARRALSYAGAAARWYDGDITVLHVVPEMPLADVIPSLEMVGPIARTPVRVDRRRLEQAAVRFVRREVPAGIPFEVRLVDEREAAREIVEAATTSGTDLIVMAAHEHEGLARVLQPSVTEAVLPVAPCPVLVVPPHAVTSVPPGDAQFDRIVCGVDFSNESVSALAAAVILAEDADAHLTLLNVVEVPAELREHTEAREPDVAALRAADVAERLRHLRQLLPEGARTYCHVETMVGEGSAGREILRVAAERHADLIVIGVRGHGAIDQLVFGSSAREILRGATCPVLFVH